MEKSKFNYYLPPELIAQTPIDLRDHSRLMILDKSQKTLEHKIFKEIVNYLRPKDLLILNNSKVMPARLICKQGNNENYMEFLLLREHEKDIWEVMVKPGKRAKLNKSFYFGNKLVGTIIKVLDNGDRLVKFDYSGDFYEVLEVTGEIPLPHYIKEKLKDKTRYQTIYSKYIGSAAAPTAGLHFTNELLDKIKGNGINIGFVTLHVGIGTFRPVKEKNIEDHKMHEEFFTINEETAEIINKTKREKGRIIAVGTTSCRVLEAVYKLYGKIKACSGFTKIFIYPGFKFNVVDALITNFHLPESTLIMLVAAFCDREFVMKAYNIAIENRYRFYSFGDAMFIY